MALLRISVGVIYIWFGLLKCIPNASPAEDIAAQTLTYLSFGLVNGGAALPLLGIFELIIGLGLLFKKLNYIVPLMYVQMVGTIVPLFAFPDQTWRYFPLVPTLEGQYILKNAVIIAAGIVLGAVGGGAQLITDPQLAQKAHTMEQIKEKRKP